jgi:hypothetical protein
MVLFKLKPMVLAFIMLRFHGSISRNLVRILETWTITFMKYAFLKPTP